ncbi:hypothetical protein Lal_00014433 [Lupinus albus]|nr:hypothetical protein Lal_00014433 [Lupinus albus]
MPIFDLSEQEVSALVAYIKAQVLAHGHRHRAGRACAVEPDAAAAGLSGQVRLYRRQPLLPVRHHARNDHGDLPAHGAVPGRLRQLPDPADAGRARHGVSVSEHAQLLGVSAGRAGAGGELFRTRRAHRCGLDVVSAAGDPAGHAGHRMGHRADAGVARDLHRGGHHGRAELRDHHAAGAHAGHDAHAHAAHGVGHLYGNSARAAGVSSAVRVGHHDAARQDAGHQLLRAGGGVDGAAAQAQRRQPAAVPAPVLVLRPPRGLHRRAARLRHRVGPHQHACAQEHLRLPDDGVGHPHHRCAVLCRLGSPHVRGGHEPVLRLLLCHHHADHRHPDRAQGLQLGADTVAGRHPPDRTDAVRHRLHQHVRDRWVDGAVPRQRQRRHSAVQHVLRGCAFPHGDGRLADPGGVWRALSLVSEGDGPHAERHAGARAFLDHLHRHVPDLLPDALPGRAGHAAPVLRLHPTLRADAEHVHHRHRHHRGAGAAAVPLQPGVEPRARQEGRGQPVAGDHARMADAADTARARQLGPDAARGLSLGIRVQPARPCG